MTKNGPEDFVQKVGQNNTFGRAWSSLVDSSDALPRAAEDQHPSPRAQTDVESGLLDVSPKNLVC